MRSVFMLDTSYNLTSIDRNTDILLIFRPDIFNSKFESLKLLSEDLFDLRDTYPNMSLLCLRSFIELCLSESEKQSYKELTTRLNEKKETVCRIALTLSTGEKGCQGYDLAERHIQDGNGYLTISENGSILRDKLSSHGLHRLSLILEHVYLYSGRMTLGCFCVFIFLGLNSCNRILRPCDLERNLGLNNTSRLIKRLKSSNYNLICENHTYDRATSKGLKLSDSGNKIFNDILYI